MSLSNFSRITRTVITRFLGQRINHHSKGKSFGKSIPGIIFLVSDFSTSTLNKDVLYEKQGSIAMIGLNRMESRNSINRSVANELNSRIKQFESDPDCSVGVLYGVGGSFCSGYDLAEIHQQGFKELIETEVS